ncbi:hypothetical protein AB0I61_17220 [Polymorphospora rubra]|uniref:hypothetical protein n=1 Tax=Polymorphospora rubra TaxID=338584 RepID=UPI0033F06B54
MIRRLVLVVSATVVAGTAGTLALAAAALAYGWPAGSVLTALAAVFVTQPLYVLARRPR